MTRWMIFAVLLGAAGVAHASSTPMVQAPAGWRSDAEQAADIGKSVTASRPFTDPAATAAAEVYAPADGARITLIVSRATSRDPKLDRPAASRGAIDDLHGIVDRAKLSGAKPVEDAWTRAVNEGELELQATLAWHDPEAGTHEDAQIIFAQDAATLVSVTGECLSAVDAPAADVAACKAALATLDPGIAKEQRIMIPPPQEPEAGSSTSTSTSTIGSNDAPSHPDMPLAHMADGSRISLPPMAIPQDTQTDRRPVYFGGGIVILAAAFFFNRRRRERFEPESDKDKPDDR